MALSKIKTNSIEDDAVTATQIATDAVDTSEIAASAVETAEILDANVTLAKIASQAANTVLVRDASSSGVLSAKALATTEILIGDGTGFTAAALSGDVTMSNAGAVTIATDAVDIAMLSATGTASATTYLRGDNAWSTVESLPTQTSKDGYTLITDGTDASWAIRSGRNIVTNGAMQIYQRGSSTGVTGTGYVGPDHVRLKISSLGTWTITQDSSAPDGFGSSYKVDCTTADASPAAADHFVFQSNIEGYDLQQLKKGTSSAESMTLSFWVKCNQTGTMRVNPQDGDNNRQIGGSYVISAADTWEYKTVTWAGDTTGAYDNDANASLRLNWFLDSGTDYTSGTLPTSWETLTQADENSGSTINLADNTANYWQITGIQLEIGTVATPFEHKTVAQELHNCYRYYERWGAGGGPTVGLGARVPWADGQMLDADTGWMQWMYKGVKRAAPSFSFGSAVTDFNFVCNGQGVAPATTTQAYSDQWGSQMNLDSTVSHGSAYACMVYPINSNAYWAVDAEL